jgi:hypothetical protein
VFSISDFFLLLLKIELLTGLSLNSFKRLVLAFRRPFRVALNKSLAIEFDLETKFLRSLVRSSELINFFGRVVELPLFAWLLNSAIRLGLLALWR